MIVLKVYLAGIAVRKSKCQAPVLVHLHSPRTGAVSLQLMEAKVWQADIVQSGRGVDHVKPISKASGEFRRNSSLAVGFEELAQALMLE